MYSEPTPVADHHHPKMALARLSQNVRVGDLIFINVAALPFQKISLATQCWSNHVGIITEIRHGEPVVAESRFPLSGSTTLNQFIRRSKAGRVTVRRTNAALSETQQRTILAAAERRSGIFYDTGFNIDSKRQFCSRFVHEVLYDATGIALGDIESLATIFNKNTGINIGFWRLWYFRGIPWQRLTITPASLYHCKKMHTLFDGSATVK